MQEFVAFANSLADEAGKIVKTYFRQPFVVESKADDTPVTIADREIEQKLRAMIEDTYPEHGIIGEEFGVKESESAFTWVLDPIDGTKAFTIGLPTFGTLIALCENGVPVLGIIDQAISEERWVGCNGEATFNEQPIKTRKCASLAQANGVSTTAAWFDVPKRVMELCRHVTWGSDCYGYGLLASGFCDVNIEADMKIYDYAALVPIIEGAGGKICDWEGEPLTLESGDKVVALGDATLWDEVKKLINN